MTPITVEQVELLPCPFCGGKAKRLTLGPDDGPDNEGGDVIICTGCNTSSHVEFGFKENLVSLWNTRTQSEGVREAAWAEAVNQIAIAAHAIGWQAGVGGMETAGAIVSYLANHTDQIGPFFRDEVSPIDWRDFVNGGCLTWHAQKGGKIIHPSEVLASPVPQEEK